MAGKWVVVDDTWGGEYPVPASFKFGEALAFEKVTGRPIEDVQKGGLRVTMGLLWLAMKQVHPDITFGDLEDIDMNGVEQVEAKDEEESAEADAEDENPTSAPEGADDAPA